MLSAGGDGLIAFEGVFSLDLEVSTSLRARGGDSTLFLGNLLRRKVRSLRRRVSFSKEQSGIAVSLLGT